MRRAHHDTRRFVDDRVAQCGGLRVGESVGIVDDGDAAGRCPAGIEPGNREGHRLAAGTESLRKRSEARGDADPGRSGHERAATARQVTFEPIDDRRPSDEVIHETA